MGIIPVILGQSNYSNYAPVWYSQLLKAPLSWATIVPVTIGSLNLSTIPIRFNIHYIVPVTHQY